MSFFTFDESKVSTGGELVAVGTYEATITNAEVTKTKDSAPMLSLTYEVRSDYQQNHQGAKFLYNNFTFATEGAKGMVQGLLKSAGFVTGHPFKDIEDMAKQLFNKHLQITVKHEPDYKDKSIIRARVNYTNPSTIGAPQGQAPITVGESDLPF